MHHTQQTQVLEVRYQSLLSSTLHPNHPHTTDITPQSLPLAHNVNSSQHTTNTRINNHTTSHTFKSERGQLHATPGRRQDTKSRVSHSLLQICIHTVHTHPITPQPLSLFLSISLSFPRSLFRSQCQSTPTLATHPSTTTITQYHSLTRVRDVSCAPHPADARA